MTTDDRIEYSGPFIQTPYVMRLKTITNFKIYDTGHTNDLDNLSIFCFQKFGKINDCVTFTTICTNKVTKFKTVTLKLKSYQRNIINLLIVSTAQYGKSMLNTVDLFHGQILVAAKL